MNYKKKRPGEEKTISFFSHTYALYTSKHLLFSEKQLKSFCRNMPHSYSYSFDIGTDNEYITYFILTYTHHFNVHDVSL